MTAALSRSLLALALATVVLAAIAAPVGAATTDEDAPQQQQVTELDLRASLTGELFVVAGWFELTALVEGSLDTTAQETDLGGTYDVGLTDSLGAFEFRGEVVGTVDASRVLFTFEGDASSFGGAESTSPSAVSSATDEAVGSSRVVTVAGGPTSLAFVAGEAAGADPTPVLDSAAASRVTPLQSGSFRLLGVSFLDVYWQLATLVLGVVLFGVLPGFSRRVADLGAGEPVRTSGAGLVVTLVVPVVLLLVGLSLFGVPLAVVGAALYLVFWWVGAVYGRFTVGMWLLGAVPRALAAVDVDADVSWVENGWAGLLVGAFAVGFLVQIPIAGPTVEAAVLLLGLGGVSRLAYRSYRRTERGDPAHPIEAATGQRDE